MFFPPADDDDLFMPQPSYSSNLSELFGNIATVAPGSSDLTYVAPKQPKGTPKQLVTPQGKVTKPQAAVLLAKVVTVFKIENNERKRIGKYGLALVGNSNSGVKEIMLYKDKQNVLTKATVTNNYEILIENDFVNIIDNNKHKWQVQFEDQKNLAEFTEELNKSNIKVNRITIAIKVNEDAVKKEAVINEKKLNEDNETEDVAISQTRAEILSRMAKMGQAILPNITQTKINAADGAPAETIEPKAVENVKENSPSEEFTKTKIKSYTMASPSPTQQLSPYMPVLPTEYLQNTPLMSTIISSQEFNMFTSENRIQNSEVRMNLTAISNKLDNVLSEVSKIREPNTDKLENEFLKSKIKDLEAQINKLTKQVEETDNSKTKYSEIESLMRSKDQEIKENREKIMALENSTKVVEYLQEKLKISSDMEDSLNQKILDLEQQLNTGEKAKNELNLQNDELQELNNSLLQNNELLREKLKSLEAKEKTYTDSTQKNLDHKVKGVSDIVKNSMNSLYQNIMGQIEDPLNQIQIKTTLYSNIKHTTFSVIQRLQEHLLLSEDLGDVTN